MWCCATLTYSFVRGRFVGDFDGAVASVDTRFLAADMVGMVAVVGVVGVEAVAFASMLFRSRFNISLSKYVLSCLRRTCRTSISIPSFCRLIEVACLCTKFVKFCMFSVRSTFKFSIFLNSMPMNHIEQNAAVISLSFASTTEPLVGVGGGAVCICLERSKHFGFTWARLMC